MKTSRQSFEFQNEIQGQQIEELNDKSSKPANLYESEENILIEEHFQPGSDQEQSQNLIKTITGRTKHYL